MTNKDQNILPKYISNFKPTNFCAEELDYAIFDKQNQCCKPGKCGHCGIIFWFGLKKTIFFIRQILELLGYDLNEINRKDIIFGMQNLQMIMLH